MIAYRNTSYYVHQTHTVNQCSHLCDYTGTDAWITSRIVIYLNPCEIMTILLVYSIKAYIAATHAKTVLPPVHLDANEPWEKWAGLSRGSCDVIVAINLLQYSSFKTAQVGNLRK